MRARIVMKIQKIRCVIIDLLKRIIARITIIRRIDLMMMKMMIMMMVMKLLMMELIAAVTTTTTNTTTVICIISSRSGGWVGYLMNMTIMRIGRIR